MNERLARTFILSVAAILATTAMAKLYGIVAYAGTLRSIDPIVRIRTDLLLVGVVFLELATAGFLLSRADSRSKLFAILWLSSLFIVYRLGLLQIGYTKPCPSL